MRLTQYEAIQSIRNSDSIFAVIENIARGHPKNASLVDDEKERVSYGELLEHIEQFQSQLSSVGVTRSSRIAIVVPNGIDMAAVLLATTCTAVAVPLNPNNSKAEFRSYFEDIGVTHLIVLSGSSPTAREVAIEKEIPIFEISKGRRLILPNHEIGSKASQWTKPNRDDIAIILLTSGSTGRPKKVPLSHGNICVSAADVCATLQLSETDICLCMWEQFHIGGLVDLLLAPLAVGGQIVCTRGFNVDNFFRIMESHKPTWFQGVPAALYPLSVRAKTIKPAKFSSLRFIRSVASALDPKLMQDIEELFDVPVVQTFGMTEAAPLITTNPLPPGERKAGSVGKSCGPEIRIEGPDGEILPLGEIGEVVIRGPNVFRGYEDNPEANAKSFRNGWFRTGDTGLMDDEGYLFLRGRIKELINRGGEKIGPFEVEEALLQHPAIAQAAVFSVTHKTLGEDIAAAVVLKADQALDITTLRLFLFELLSPFKVPSQIAFRKTLPLNPVGKVDKLNLVKELEERNREENLKAKYSKPRHGLDQFLVEVWARELDIGMNSFGIDDNFSNLGGDSLSSLQILDFIEDRFSISIPEQAAQTFLTIRAMSDGLDELGVSPQELDAKGALGPKTANENASEGEVYTLPSGDLDFISNSIRSLKSATSETEFQVAQKEILTFATPEELAAIFPREVIFRTLPAEWKRTQIAPNVWRYHAGKREAASAKSAIFGFTGNAQRLMVPIHLILSSLDHEKFDIILLRDPKRMHYESGVDGVGDSLEAVYRFLNFLNSEFAYRSAFALGTSSGGLAALGAALANKWQGVLAVGPDSPKFRPKINAVLAAHHLRKSDESSTNIHIALSGQNKRDRDSMEDITSLIVGCKVHIDERYANHNLFYELFKVGELRGFLRDIFV
jgi:acyl-CoA synthetase (AMP-forming)/AMP-acid ligase II/acyl carrier protein